MVVIPVSNLKKKNNNKKNIILIPIKFDISFFSLHNHNHNPTEIVYYTATTALRLQALPHKIKLTIWCVVEQY